MALCINKTKSQYQMRNDTGGGNNNLSYEYHTAKCIVTAHHQATCPIVVHFLAMILIHLSAYLHIHSTTYPPSRLSAYHTQSNENELARTGDRTLK